MNARYVKTRRNRKWRRRHYSLTSFSSLNGRSPADLGPTIGPMCFFLCQWTYSMNNADQITWSLKSWQLTPTIPIYVTCHAFGALENFTVVAGKFLMSVFTCGRENAKFSRRTRNFPAISFQLSNFTNFCDCFSLAFKSAEFFKWKMGWGGGQIFWLVNHNSF